MNGLPVRAGAVLLLSLLAAGSARSAETPSLPSVRGQKALAAVEGEPVTWAEFREALGEVHSEALDHPEKRGRQDPNALLQRMITAKLVVAEARNIGLDDDPAHKSAVDGFRRAEVQKMLLERHARTVTKPDPRAVQIGYRMKKGIASLDSAFFENEKDAIAVESSVRGGKSLREAAAAFVEAGHATLDAGKEISLAEVQPEVAGAIAALSPGELSRVLPVGKGFTLVRLVSIRTPEDPAARKEAEQEALELARLRAVGDYVEDLKKRYATVDSKLLDSLDLEAESPGLDALSKDARPVATIRGAAPVTVGDLTKAIEAKFFHGTKRAAEKKRMNVRKPAALHQILLDRLAALEGKRLGIDASPELRASVADFEEKQLFGAFLSRVVAPDVKVEESDVRKHYDAHAADYTTPEMMRLDSIAFGKREEAAAALEKFRKGSDFLWLAQNAPGRVVPAPGVDLLQFGGRVYTSADVDPELRKALGDVKSGEARLFTPGGGLAYVVLVRERIEPKRQPLESVHDSVEKQVLNEKTQALLEDWSTKLRSAYKVETFVTPAQLEQLVRREIGRPS